MVLSARQGKALNDQISSINTSLTNFSSIFKCGAAKNIYRYGVVCDKPTTTTLTIRLNTPYNDLSCLIFTRGALSVMIAKCDENGKTGGVKLQTIVGEAGFSAAISNNAVVLTISSWEVFEMLFVSHYDILPSFTVS